LPWRTEKLNTTLDHESEKEKYRHESDNGLSVELALEKKLLYGERMRHFIAFKILLG